MTPQQPTVLITGCSDHGIGSALAHVFHARGYHVFATARNPSKMKTLANLNNVTLLTLDVRDSTQIARAVDAVRAQTGGSLTYLINNAGRNHFMPVLDEDLDAGRELFETNVWGQVAVTKGFVPLLLNSGGDGAVVFTTSISGYLNVPYMGTYAASKRSLELIAETLRLELAPFGVRVLSIVTGAVQTMGQTYFGDFKLPDNSLYKSIEGTIAARARGEDGRGRGDLMAYAEEVVSAIESGAEGRVWCGENAESTRLATTNPAVPAEVMDRGVAQGTGLDVLSGQLKG
ncbi:putative hydroxybutyrate dehydrogenase [Aspergillus steynii IBT 23096]|uniref:Putative hydroxybutyrate dehydrogenase n=1 Tax=Aspergillus steynii IBT 23096 TaxID=1392250 RepID=A0A2I2GD25_9EURO|nr:putative hydroxybutyrate dehydrogenase [Aspergillus steynii IBT 23096]PLB50770.1 putative hydroxybutyrate dehydrogenase [Aspergillus steynii IBT 23096]